MSAANFDRCLKHVLKHEGGYVNHPDDPGGATNRGVTQATYDAYRARKRLGRGSVRRISQQEVREIYKQQYWDRVRGDDLPAGVDNCVFDYAVNSGVVRASKELQHAAGVTADGRIGLLTLSSVDNCDRARLITLVCDRRIAFLQRLRHWKTFGRGWTRRVSGVRSVSLAMAKDAPVPPEAPSSDEPREPGPASENPRWELAAAILAILNTLLGRK